MVTIINEVGLWFMVFNVTFNNISVISWQCFFGGGNRSARKKLQVNDKLYQIMLYEVHQS